jgi:hypothetical protein
MKFLSMALAVATITTAAIADQGSSVANRFGKGPTTAGLGSGGWDTGVARTYIQDFHQYVQTAPKVEPAVALYASDQIGDYIDKAAKHFAWMRAEAVKTNDKESLASLDVIDLNLAAAKKAHDDMHGVCLRATIDKPAVMKCCEQIDDPLAKVIAEHDKLMKRLGQPNPAPAASTR